MLRIDNLTKRYGERVALKSLSFALPRAQFVALLGPNGAGKSTLFQVLTGLFAADEGQVEIAGHSLRSAPIRESTSAGRLRCAAAAW
jgi:ABC-2 type transport system ATP-binding protein